MFEVDFHDVVSSSSSSAFLSIVGIIDGFYDEFLFVFGHFLDRYRDYMKRLLSLIIRSMVFVAHCLFLPIILPLYLSVNFALRTQHMGSFERQDWYQ